MSENNSGTVPPDQPLTEKIRVRGEAMVAQVKELLHEGNVKRITIKDSAGHTVMEIPVTAGVVAAVFAPALVAVAAIAALASDWDIEVSRSVPETSVAH